MRFSFQPWLLSDSPSLSSSCWLALLAFTIVQPHALAQSAERPEIITVFETNPVPRYITNVIKVAIPTNYFYTEFRTNWFRDRRTNVIQVLHTNVLTDYRTNVDYVTQYLTNYTTRFQTNLETITITNWEIANLRVTNFVTLPKINGLEPVAPPPAERLAGETPSPSTKPPAAGLTAPDGIADQLLEFEVAASETPSKPGEFSVTITLRAGAGSTNTIPVAEWRVERADRAALMLGARPEFTGTLLPGSHQITARYKDPKGALRTVRGDLAIGGAAKTQRIPARARTAAP